jgi:integrase
MPYQDIPAFVAALRGRAQTSATRGLLFLIITATRLGEGRGACWSEIDLDAMVWTIPAARMSSLAIPAVNFVFRAAMENTR